MAKVPLEDSLLAVLTDVHDDLSRRGDPSRVYDGNPMQLPAKDGDPEGLLAGQDTFDGAEAPPLDDETIESIVREQLQNSRNFIDNEVSPLRLKATQAYQGEPFGNEVKGRSQVVLTDVRDTVDALMPDLLKVFFGPRRILEFVPDKTDEHTVKEAAQQTSFVEWIVREDNPGFLTFTGWFKDALVRKLGIVRVWWDTNYKATTYTMLDRSAEDLAVLQSDPEVTTLTLRDQRQGEDGQPRFDVEVRRQPIGGCARFEVVPPEEFLISRDARSDTDCTLIGQRTRKRRGDLRKLGVPDSILDDCEPSDMREPMGGAAALEAAQRMPMKVASMVDPNGDPELDWIDYCDVYVLLPTGPEDALELRRVITVGAGDALWRHEAVAEHPFALLCPDPEPSTIWGFSIADKTMDIQLIRSMVTRSTLDSLALSIVPRTAVVEGRVRLEDLTSPKLNNVVRMSAPGMVQEMNHTFVGAQALPILDLFDAVRESRTGITRAASGLDPDSLQSSTRAAVGATVTAAAQRKELIARVFAETGVKTLFGKLLRLVVANQNAATVARINGEYVTIDPRPWNADRDLTVNVALGVGLIEQQQAALGAYLGEIKGLMQIAGPNNPVAGLGQMSQTLGKLLELAGLPPTTQFINLLPPDYQVPPPPPPPPTPEQVLANAQIEVANKQLVQKESELALKWEEMRRLDDRERDKNEGELYLKAMQMEIDAGLKVNANEMKVQLAAIVKGARGNDKGVSQPAKVGG